MVTVVADTSPLQYLFQVGLIDLLQVLFEAVSVQPARQAPALERFELDPGEHGVLSLALGLEESVVLLDDAAARTAASDLGLRTTGTLGILLLAKKRGLIAAVTPVLADLQRRGFRITHEMRRRILQLASE